MPGRRPFSSWPAALAVTIAAVGCRASGPPPRAPAAQDEGWSRIVVHTSVEPPVGVRLSPGVALVLGRPNSGGERPGPSFERVDAFPVERRCRMQSVCTLTIRNRLGAVVFAFDPVVEVEIVPSSDPRRPAEVRYRDRGSVSAALAEINELGAALELACHRTDVERAQRLERAAPLEHELRQLVAAADRPVVERAARLALVQGECTGAPENRAIATRLLDALEPTAPELGPWTDALRRLGSLAGDPERAEALVDAVIERHPDPAVGARLLFLRVVEVGEDDPRARDAIERRLASPRFAKTGAAALAKRLFAARDTIGLVPGDRWPTIELANVDGGTIHTEDMGAGPRLLYFSASWCKGCVESLPDVRELAAAHPEVRVVYVLWDGPNDAREFVKRRAPVPGDVAWTDSDTRELLRSQVMRYVALPSFVLVGADGTVIATSDDTELAQIEARLRASPQIDSDPPAGRGSEGNLSPRPSVAR